LRGRKKRRKSNLKEYQKLRCFTWPSKIYRIRSRKKSSLQKRRRKFRMLSPRLPISVS